jgi:hypothetical protein
MRDERRWDEWNSLPSWRPFITPDNFAMIGTFREIRDGRRTIYVEDPDERGAEVAALQAKRLLRCNSWVREGYIAVDSPIKVESEPGVWVISLFLHDNGVKMLAAIDQGLVWRTEDGDVGVDETASLAFWREKMRGGEVEHTTFARVAALTHPMLKPVVKEFTIFRLMAERSEDRIGRWWRAPRAQVAAILGDHCA